VKVDPLPCSLVTVMSPPMIWQNLRLKAKPSPVPPYFLVVDASADVEKMQEIIRDRISGLI